jgi:hypothetical protein
MGFEGYDEHPFVSRGASIPESKQSVLSNGHASKECSMQDSIPIAHDANGDHASIDDTSRAASMTVEIEVTPKSSTSDSSLESLQKSERNGCTRSAKCKPKSAHSFGRQQGKVRSFELSHNIKKDQVLKAKV